MKTNWRSKLLVAGMILGFGGGSFSGVVLEIGWLVALGLALFLGCWIRLTVQTWRER